jgi:hypothetical protein
MHWQQATIVKLFEQGKFVTDKEKGVRGCGFSSLEIVVETYFRDFKAASSSSSLKKL